jgi:DNA repair protein SbcC/Rad50
MRVDKLTIKNFKNYNGEITFDLSKQITVLHGDNGYGKSTFFDAIEWCFTNKIDRFDGTEGEIKKDIINRNSQLGSFQVLVCIEFGGNQLTRSFNVTNGEVGNTQVKLKEKSEKITRGQENIEELLKSEYLKGMNFGKGNYGQLIKKTYILSQDQVTEFVTSEDSEERYRALANIMGLKSVLIESDNAKKILAALKNEAKEYENKINQYDESIKSKKEAKHFVDLFEMNSKLFQLGLDQLEEDIETRCKALHSEIANRKSSNEAFIRFYREFNLERYGSVNKLKDHINNYEDNQHHLKLREKNSDDLLLKVKERIKSLKREKKNLINYNQIRFNIREHENNLIQLNLNGNNIEEIDSKLTLLRERASKIEYHISILHTLASNTERIEVITEQKKLFNHKKYILFKRKVRYEYIVKELTSSIEDNQNKLLVNLISNIKDIQEYVKTNNIDTCPVCSSVPENDLKECIDHNLIFFNSKIEEDTKYVQKSIKLKKKLENKVQVFIEVINKILSKAKSNELLLQRLNEESINYKSNSLYVKELENITEEDLERNLKSIREEIRILQKALESLLVLRELYDNLKDIESRDSSNKQRDYKNRLEVDLDKSLERFLKAEKRISKYILRIRDSIANVKLEIQELNQILLRIGNFVSESDFNQSLSFIFSHALDVVRDSEHKNDILSNVTEMLVALRMNGEVEKQIQAILEEQSKLDIKRRGLGEVIETFDQHINKKSNKFGKEVKDYLNKYDSPIQRYFRYLNPIPSNGCLRFEGKDEELYIKVIFGDESKDKLVSNAKNVLSSGQLNVLAISIFLAINEGQKTHSLDFVAIDDPIQNMDDVNQYSICDILGYIKKQLIISTHDIEFLKLFIKKNEYRKDDIQVYSFRSPYLTKEKVQHIKLI